MAEIQGMLSKLAPYLMGAGAGLLSSRGQIEGLGPGLLQGGELAQQQLLNRLRIQQEERGKIEQAQKDELFARQKQQFAAGDEYLKTLPPDLQALGGAVGAPALGAAQAEAMFRKNDPKSYAGKLADDLARGLISKSDYDAVMKKQTYIAPETGNGGPFSGTAMDAQFLNILLKGDPASPEFAAAYSQMAQPKVSVDPATQQVRVVAPDMSAFRNPQGQTPSTTQTPTPAPDAQTTPLPSGGNVTVLGDSTTREAKKTRDATIVEAAGIVNAMKDFAKSAESAGAGEKAASFAGVNTPLNTAYNKAAMLSKAEALFNLGVLNGQDLAVLQKIIPDPSTWRGAVGGAGSAKAATNAVIQLLQDKINARAMQMGEEPINIVEYGQKVRGQDAPTAPQAGGIKFMGFE